MEVSLIIRLALYAFLGLGIVLAFHQFFDSINKAVILTVLFLAVLLWQDLYFNISLIGFLLEIENTTYLHMLVMGLLALFFMMSILNPKKKGFKYYYKVSVFSLVIGSLLCHASSAVGFDIGYILLGGV